MHPVCWPALIEALNVIKKGAHYEWVHDTKGTPAPQSVKANRLPPQMIPRLRCLRPYAPNQPPRRQCPFQCIKLCITLWEDKVRRPRP